MNKLCTIKLKPFGNYERGVMWQITNEGVIWMKSFIKKFVFHKSLIRKVGIFVNGVRVKLICAFMIPVIFILILGVSSYNKSSAGMIYNYKTSTLTSIETKAEYLSLGFDTIVANMMNLSTLKNLSLYLQGNWKEDVFAEHSVKVELTSSFNAIEQSEKYISGIYAFSDYGSGITTQATLTDTILKQFKQSREAEYINGSKNNLVWLGDHSTLDKDSKKTQSDYSISCAKIILTKNGEASGYLIIDISRDFVTDTLNKLNLPHGSYAGFITPDGRELLSDGAPEGFSFAKEGIVPNEDNMSGYEYTAYNGEKYLFLYSKVKTSDGYIYALIPNTEIIKQASEVKDLTVIIVILAVLIAVFCGVIIAKGIGDTIGKINKVIEKTAKGDLTDLTCIKRKDELGVLGRSINDMINSMKTLINNMANVGKTVFKSAFEVTSNTELIMKSAQNITYSVGDIEQGIIQQAKDSEQCVLQMSGLADQINGIRNAADQIEKASYNAQETISRGVNIIDKLGSAAVNTTEITRMVITDIQDLNDKTNYIYKIIYTINEIAQQTKLLSLNASIEAARAGEAGRGFSVVAKEIRRLAEQSSKASEEISGTIEKIQKQTNKTVSNAKIAEVTLDSQQTALNDTIQIFESISGSVTGLFTNIQIISEKILNMDVAKTDTLEAIESISATSEETAAVASQLRENAEKQLKAAEYLNEAAEYLSRNSENMKESIRTFKLE